MAEFMACQVCQRVIWVKDGPVCVFCREPEPEVHPEAEAADEKPAKGKKTDG